MDYGVYKVYEIMFNQNDQYIRIYEGIKKWH